MREIKIKILELLLLKFQHMHRELNQIVDAFTKEYVSLVYDYEEIYMSP